MKKCDLFFNEICTQYVIEVISQLEFLTCMFKQRCYNRGNKMTSDFKDNRFVEQTILYQSALVIKVQSPSSRCKWENTNDLDHVWG